MTVQSAILIGAAIIGAAIAFGKIIAPYEIATGTATVWRLNELTGAVRLCNDTIYAHYEDAAPTRCR